MACPICSAETEAKYRPFCSKRCADIDLGRWMTGSYTISTAPSDDDVEELADALEEELEKRNRDLH